jgi:addiction module RelB/DinJ family antitoxin
MNNTVVSVKIDKDVKQAAQAVAKNAGLNLSSLINAYLRQVVATRRIEIYSPEPMTPELEEAIAVVEAEIKAGHVSKAYDDVDELMTDLLKV